MPHVLTTGSNVTCGHRGSVSTTSTARLKVDGKSVLLNSSLVSQAVDACTIQNDPNTTTVQCSMVTSVTAGEGTKLTVQGQPVMLDTLAGGTNGTISNVPQTLLSATAGQSKMTTS